MSQAELLKRTAGVLDRLGISFMLSGSLVSSLQGEPRSTHDIDLVVDIGADRIDALVQAFGEPEFYLSRDAIEAAVADQGMFNLLDIGAGDKVDFWLLTDEPFDQSRFARRRRIEIDGTPVWVSAPEDTILMKLKWGREAGGSEQQFQDALRVYEVQHGVLQLEYLQHWTVELGLQDDWQRLLAEAKPLDR